MKLLLFFLVLTAFVLVLSFLCRPFPGPRHVNWRKEWRKSETKLKRLALDILAQGDKKYGTGNNNFPEDFHYPFDEGFFIQRTHTPAGGDTINTQKLTVTFYMDRGLLDHYSAFIYTNDSVNIREFDDKVEHGANDFRIEPGWYMIND